VAEKKPTNNLRRRCHTYDEKAWKIATKKHGNSDETSWQRKNPPTAYDADAILATKKRGRVKKIINGLRRTYVAISTPSVGLKKKIEYSLIIYARGMNLCIYEPVHGFLWYQEIKYIKALFRACELIALIFPGSLHMKAPRLDCSSRSSGVMPPNTKIPQTPAFMSERNVYLHLNIASLRLCRSVGLQRKGTIIDQR
jgi:hypothetical protein